MIWVQSVKGSIHCCGYFFKCPMPLCVRKRILHTVYIGLTKYTVYQCYSFGAGNCFIWVQHSTAVAGKKAARRHFCHCRVKPILFCYVVAAYCRDRICTIHELGKYGHELRAGNRFVGSEGAVAVTVQDSPLRQYGNCFIVPISCVDICIGRGDRYTALVGKKPFY